MLDLHRFSRDVTKLAQDFPGDMTLSFGDADWTAANLRSFVDAIIHETHRGHTRLARVRFGGAMKAKNKGHQALCDALTRRSIVMIVEDDFDGVELTFRR